VGTLASELAAHADRIATGPRIYADANVPARLVEFMRQALGWDVFFVLDEPALRRAADVEHFRLSRQLRRTLVTLDRDYLDDRRFPPEAGSGVLVLSAPDERQLQALVTRVHRILFSQAASAGPPLPLAGTKLQLHTDWRRDAE
jgi:predicted nuclease of predicted toxin-antitoxin system